jgi:hypothetical protein
MTTTPHTDLDCARLTSCVSLWGVVMWYEADQDWERHHTYRRTGSGFAWKVLGRHVAQTDRGPVLTGLVVAYMVGDYDPHIVDPTELRRIGRGAYCPSSGQILQHGRDCPCR